MCSTLASIGVINVISVYSFVVKLLLQDQFEVKLTCHWCCKIIIHVY